MTRSGVLQCLFAAVLFGATAPVASELAASIPAITLAGLLYLGAAIGVAPFVLMKLPAVDAIRAEWRPAMAAVVVGGALGPVLLTTGLARTSAATASILLNTELAATVVIAAVFFREHLGGRLLSSALMITAAGALLTWEPGATVDIGALLIIAACVCWGFDNSVTAAIEHLAPEHVVALKGVMAGGVNLAIGLVVAGGLGDSADVGHVVAALLVGAAGYGWSITLWVKGARELGAARGQVIFATAPFIGAAIAWIVLSEPVVGIQVVAAIVAAAGVAVSLRSDHEHEHHHHVLVHEHEHTHDDGHHDDHHDEDVVGRHTHRHRHVERVHAHAHVPDLHHRHEHPPD